MAQVKKIIPIKYMDEFEIAAAALEGDKQKLLEALGKIEGIVPEEFRSTYKTMIKLAAHPEAI